MSSSSSSGSGDVGVRGVVVVILDVGLGRWVRWVKFSRVALESCRRR